MAAAASDAERPLAAAHPAPGEGGEDSTSLAGGGSASLDHSPLLRAVEEEGLATRAAGTPVGGLFPRGQPSPPPKRTSTTGGAGEYDDEGLEGAAQLEAEAHREAEKIEADNYEEEEFKRRQTQKEREQGAETQRPADIYESAQDQASHSGMAGPASRGGQGLPADKFVNLGNGAVNVGFSAADVGAFFYLICDMDDAEAALIVATLEECSGLANSNCGRTIAACAAKTRLDSQWPGLGEDETDDPIFLWCQALVGVCVSLKKHKHISWLTHVDRAWGRQFAQRAIRGFHDWEYNFPFGAEVAEVPEEQFEALSRVKGGMAALICDINTDNELIFTLSSNKEDPLQVFRTLDKIADIVDWWIPRGIGGNTVVICPTYLMLPIRTMAAWCSQRRRAEIIKGSTPSRQMLYLPTSCALLGNLSHLLHGNGKRGMGKAMDQQDLPRGQHLLRAGEEDHGSYSKKFEYEYKDTWTAKYGYDDRGGDAWWTGAYQKYKSYEQGWAEKKLQKTPEDWTNAVCSPEHNTEEKYVEKIGKTVCWFFNKGQCKKGKNCNFVHEHHQGRSAGAMEAPKAWQRDIEKKKQWKNEYEGPEYQYQQQGNKGKDYKDYIGAGDYGGYYNSPNNNKYQRHVSGTPSYSRHVYNVSSAPCKHLKPQW